MLTRPSRENRSKITQSQGAEFTGQLCLSPIPQVSSSGSICQFPSAGDGSRGYHFVNRQTEVLEQTAASATNSRGNVETFRREFECLEGNRNAPCSPGYFKAPLPPMFRALPFVSPLVSITIARIALVEWKREASPGQRENQARIVECPSKSLIVDEALSSAQQHPVRNTAESCT